jgi:hypothetical protein
MPGGYVVRNATGQALAYLYSPDNEDEARQAKVLTKDRLDGSPSASLKRSDSSKTALMQTVMTADSRTEIAATINVSRQVICER